METENNTIDQGGDDAALDAMLQQQLNDINQSKSVAEPSVAPAEPETATTSAEDTSSQVSTEEAKAEGSETQKEDEYDFKAPIRGKFESEEAYQVRLEIAEKIQLKKNAQNPAEVSAIQSEIKELRKELSSIGLNEKFTKSHHNQHDGASPDGSNDVDARAREIVQQELATREISTTLNNFVSKYKELQDDVTRDVFFDFVENNFNYQGKTAADLTRVLEIARNAMFKKPDTIQERVLKSANVQEKVNAMQFPGGTVAKPGLSPDLQKSFDELKNQGLSDDQISVLLSD